MPFNSSGLRYLGVQAINPPDTWFSDHEPTDNDYIMHDVGKLCYVAYPGFPETWSLWYLASKTNMKATWIRLWPQTIGDMFDFVPNIGGPVYATPAGVVNVLGAGLLSTDGLIANTLTINITPGLTGQLIGTDPYGNVGYLTLNSPDNSILFNYTAHPGLIDMVTAGGGGGGNLRSDDGLIAVPNAGVINVYGGEPLGVPPGNTAYVNIYTDHYIIADTHTVNINLKRSINQPVTNDTASQGMYALGGDDFLHNYGTNNTMCGIDAGNRTLDPDNAADNVFLGHFAGHAVIGAARNTLLGSGALRYAGDSPMGNICIGFEAATGYTLNESSNIIIGNGLGTIGDVNTIRIGTMGALEGQQNQCFVAGIWNSPAVPGANTGLVIVDQNGQLYVDDIDPDSVVMTNAGGNAIGVQGAYGTILTGMGTNQPAFLAFKPDNPTTPTITYAVDPTTHQIILTAHAGGTSGITNIITNTGGPVVPLAGAVSIVGNELINTDGTTANVVKVNVNRGVLGSVITGNGLGNPSTYRTLYSSNGSIIFDFATDPTKIGMVATGGGGGGIAALTGDNITDVPATASSVHIEGGKNIYTDTTVNSVTVNVTDDVYLLGYLHAVNEVQTNNGDLIALVGSLKLNNTDAGGVGGTVKFGGNTWLHNYGTRNIFQGFNSGNLTLTVGSAIDNVCVGAYTGHAITSANDCCAYGFNAMRANQTGSQCTCLGTSSLYQADASFGMCCIGYHAGLNVVAGSNNSSCIYIEDVGVANESNVMRLGHDGSGAHNINMTYLAGVYNRPLGGQPALPSPEMVVMGSDFRLGTMALPGTGITSITTDSGTVTPTTTFGIKGGYNTGTRASGTDILVDVDGSIQQNNTTSAGDGIYALGTRGANSYTTNRFMHNYGGATNVWLGYQAGPISGAVGTYNVGIGGGVLSSSGTSINNTAVGYGSMGAATSSTGCTCLGHLTGDNLTSGDYDLFLGYSTGTTTTTGSSCILLGYGVNASASATSNELRIGNATGTAVGNLNASYIHGIYGQTVGATNAAVYIDNTGKLGTGGGAGAFLYFQATNKPAIVGSDSGTTYIMGTTVILSASGRGYDNSGGAFYPGGGSSGTPAKFTAPESGIYHFDFAVLINNLTTADGAQGATIMNSCWYAIPRVVVTGTDAGTYGNINGAALYYIPGFILNRDQQNYITNVTIEMAAGDIAKFEFFAQSDSGGLSTTLGLGPIAANTDTTYATYVGGYRIS